MRWMLIAGAVLGALAVATGAFGAHALDGVLDERARGWYDTAVTYHAGHALAVLACGLLSLHVAPRTVIDPAPGRRDAGSIDPGSPRREPAEPATRPHATRSRAPLVAAAASFLVGVALFSGSLYAMAFTGLTALGMITPLGGLALIAGWVLLAVAAARLPAALS